MMRQNFKRFKDGQKAFTMIELILVIAAVAILAAILVPTVIGILDDSAVTKGKADAKAIAGSVVAFRKDVGEFPTRDASGAAGAEVNLLYSGSTAPVAADYATGSAPTSYDCTATPADCETFEFPFVTNTSTLNAYSTTGKKQWKGPYISENTVDEFDTPYIIYVARLRRVTQISGDRAWVVFAGEDQLYNTTPGSTSVQGDDFGFLIK